jgi:hypothetical protein
MPDRHLTVSASHQSTKQLAGQPPFPALITAHCEAGTESFRWQCKEIRHHDMG